MRLTPSMQQYIQIKKAYQDCILLFQMGDFYETFFDDAKLVSKTLNIVLTSREKDNPIPMAGFPMKALDQYLPKLINAGFKVAIAKQLDNNSSKGLVKRKVVEIVTKATLTTDEQLGKQKSKYIAALLQDKNHPNIVFIALTDILSGSIILYSIPNNTKLIKDFIQSQGIAEATTALNNKDITNVVSEHIPVWPTKLRSEKYYKDLILKHFNVPTLLSLGIETKSITIVIGLLLDYIKYLKGKIPAQIQTILFNKDKIYMYLDNITIKNLDLLPGRKEQPTLLEVVDNTLTPMGYRLLYESIRRPLLDKQKIDIRLNSIDILTQNPEILDKVIAQLKNISDIERLTGLIGLTKIAPKQMLMLKQSLQSSLTIFQILPQSLLKSMLNQYDIDQNALINSTQQILSLISYYLRDDASNDPTVGSIINEKNFSDIKQLRNLTANTKQIIQEIIHTIKTKYNLDKLRLGMNKIYGYYLEIPKAQAKKLPADFVRKQTLVNTERFVTPELMELENKIETAQLQLFELEHKYFAELIKKLQTHHLINLNKIYSVIGFIDFIVSGALWAKKTNSVKPILTDNEQQLTIIEQGRHPVVEPYIEQFIPNNVHLNKDLRFIVLTGPNMGGKSTYIRQVALIQILAQIGYFVPASKAKLSIKDRIFARVGASDNIAEQMSTFMVEMSEIANIIKNATQNSLIILDEVGRGTSAWEGISLAYAISEHIITQIKAHTLFATHYFELTDLENKYSAVKNFKVDVFEDKNNVIFLHTVSKGIAKKSYGIHIARMVDLPQDILKNAENLLSILNQRKLPGEIASRNNTKIIQPVQQQPLVQVEPAPVIQKIIKKLDKVDINTITPLQALELLNELKTILSKIKYG